MQNVGSVSNNGYELSLGLTMLDSKQHALGWTSTFNYAHNKNKVLNLGGDPQFDSDYLRLLLSVCVPIGGAVASLCCTALTERFGSTRGLVEEAA